MSVSQTGSICFSGISSILGVFAAARYWKLQWSSQMQKGAKTNRAVICISLSSHSCSFSPDCTRLYFFSPGSQKKKWYCRIIPAPRGLEQSIIQHCQLMARFVYLMIYWIRIFPLLISPVKFIEFLTNGLTGHGVTLTHTLQIVSLKSLKCLCSALTRKQKWNRRIRHQIKLLPNLWTHLLS